MTEAVWKDLCANTNKYDCQDIFIIVFLIETILKYLELAKHIVAYLSDKMLLLNIT